MDKKHLTPIRGDKNNVQDSYTEITRTEAIINGYVLYWNGERCENGHRSVRYTKTGICKACYQAFRAEEIEQSEMSKDPLPKAGTPIKTKKLVKKQSFNIDNPVFHENGKWYFTNETGTEKFGPHPTELSASLARDRFLKVFVDNVELKGGD